MDYVGNEEGSTLEYSRNQKVQGLHIDTTVHNTIDLV